MPSKLLLKIHDLSVKIEEKTILKSIDLTIEPGELLLILGKNGAGKSTLLKALMGSSSTPHTGTITLNGTDITKYSIDERARAGLFVGQQAPIEVPGVHMVEFLRIAHNNIHPDDKYDPWTFNELFEAYARKVGLPLDLSERNINQNLSGGERKRSEILQLLLLKPKYAFLDEIDSGLDISSFKNIFNIIKDLCETKKIGIGLITHNPKILDFIKPSKVIFIDKGEIISTGGFDLARELIKGGLTIEGVK